jgi:hypothetical protein
MFRASHILTIASFAVLAGMFAVNAQEGQPAVDPQLLQGPVRHIVAFNFEPNVTESQVQDVVRRYLALRELCVDPDTGRQYIIDFTGGTCNSKEGHQQGMRVTFQMVFPNLYLRDYFVGRPITTPFDPHHDDFKAFVGPLLLKPIEQGLIVIDWTEFDFEPLSTPTPMK